MEKITCSQLRLKLAEIKDLKKEFDLEMGKILETKNTTHVEKLKENISNNINNTNEYLFIREITAKWINPETNQEKKIVFNVNGEILAWQDFYQKHDLPIPDKKEIKQIIEKNKSKIEGEIKKYGYDSMLIIPGELPSTMELNEKMTEGYEFPTYQYDDLKKCGGLEKVEHLKSEKLRIVFCHDDQNIYRNLDANFFAKQTLGKRLIDITTLSMDDAKRKIKNQESMPINFSIEINGKKIRVQSEGLSLREYLILQRMFFEKKQQNMDGFGSSLLPKTFVGDYRIASSKWQSYQKRLGVDAEFVDEYDFDMGCRLAKGFSL